MKIIRKARLIKSATDDGLVTVKNYESIKDKDYFVDLTSRCVVIYQNIVCGKIHEKEIIMTLCDDFSWSAMPIEMLEIDI